LSSLSGNYSSSAGTGNFSIVASPSSCTWTATTNCGWITLINFSGTGDGTVSFNMDANMGVNSRSCEILVNGQIFTVTQSGTSTALSADFSAGQTSGSCPLTVNFIDQSTGSPQTYVWEFFGNGVNPNTSTSSSPIVTYSQCGVYTVKLTVVGNGNSDEKIKTGFINVTCPCVTGIDDNDETNLISIIPNPSNGKFEISISEQQNYSVKVFNTLGQIVFEKSLSAGKHIIDLVGKSKGIYLLQFKSNQQTFTKKLYID
jgi:PKD repeat protein